MSQNDAIAEVRSIVDDIEALYAGQEAELDRLRDEDGDVPSENLYEWDRLRYDVHGEQDADMLGEVRRRLRGLIESQAAA
ncbi:hypothetical protein GCM10010211_00890 [Streptomyces albospinus]|uniref:Uncharacterized protein n=1 Tax=Streptomyces albospinus TaxID=285515 RepID=A0ABQ2ULR0_9ACTN|nr:hypothetical protein [Streptomyces albospinus]GGU41692.1 hypothetical protein GCM10010211_00890 [Streptomyces albospinus]